MSRRGYQDRYVYYADTFMESPSDGRPKAHMTEAHGIVFCLSGKMKVLTEGAEYCLRPDDLLLLRDAEAHWIRIAEYPCEFIHSYFSLHYFYLFDPQYRLIRPFTERPLGANNRILGKDLNAALLRSCFESAINTDDIYMRRIAVIGALSVALSEISRVYDSGAIQAADERDELTRSILFYINDHYTEHLEPDEIASSLFVSRSQIDRIIKRATGYSLWHYINMKRLIYARHLLHQGVIIKEAASRSGFSDYSTFYKAYMKWMGTPPRIERPHEESDPLLRNFYQLDETSRMI